MAWEDLIRLLRRSRQSETITNPPFSPPVQIRRGQKAVDIARLSDSIFVKIRMTVLETLTVSDSANYLLSRIQQSVGDIISVSDLVDYLIHEYIRQNVTDNLSVSDAVNYVLASIQQITAAASDSLTLSELLRALQREFAPTDSLSLSESVTYQLTTPQQQYYIPNSFVIYNHNWQQISGALSAWWDNDTATTYSLYFTPQAPFNPRYVFLYFNTPISLPRNVNIYIGGYSPNKTLYIQTYFFGEPASSATLTPNQTGWFTVTLSAGTMGYFDEVQINTDSSIFGFIAVSEFHILQ
jgi:hypothetical protein